MEEKDIGGGRIKAREGEIDGRMEEGTEGGRRKLE